MRGLRVLVPLLLAVPFATAAEPLVLVEGDFAFSGPVPASFEVPFMQPAGTTEVVVGVSMGARPALDAYVVTVEVLRDGVPQAAPCTLWSYDGGSGCLVVLSYERPRVQDLEWSLRFTGAGDAEGRYVVLAE